jgi:hypothetical protein
MIELNCSYEESKKILELGYDFSPVCREFEHEPTNSKKIKINEDIFIEENVNIGSFDEAYPVRAVKSLLEFGFIPLIPKAALEACLPRTLNFQNCLGDLSLSRFAKRFSCEVIDLYSVMETGVTHHWFTSAFEAFLWVYENYPNELKKKFTEVMG